MSIFVIVNGRDIQPGETYGGLLPKNTDCNNADMELFLCHING